MKVLRTAATIGLIVFASSSQIGAATTIVHPVSGSQAVSVSGGETFFDSGGNSANYSNNENGVMTFCPAAGGRVALSINAFAVEECNTCGCFDTVSFYNGATIADPLIFSGCGDFEDNCTGNSAVCIQAGDSFESTATNGCLTVGFTSDGSFTYFGWEMLVSVLDAPGAPGAAPIPAVSGAGLIALLGGLLGLGGFYARRRR
jgi:hypothetical protein